PDLCDIPSGCAFHPRCRFVIEICKKEIPEYREVESDHFIRCHRWGDIEQE
ncbi:MAG: oligopeptide/dipeptide ABC transporter ATP-binding protein, partial [Candidatus Thorarchaeota archaeon]